MLSEQHAIKTHTLELENTCIALRELHKGRQPRTTDYGTRRTQEDWTRFGRTANLHT